MLSFALNSSNLVEAVPLRGFSASLPMLAILFQFRLLCFRAVEVLTGSDTLTLQLHYPAEVKIRKMHNVELLLQTLVEMGCAVDPIKANDIVEGHRERSLALIWRIVLHFQVRLNLFLLQAQNVVGRIHKKGVVIQITAGPDPF